MFDYIYTSILFGPLLLQKKVRFCACYFILSLGHDNGNPGGHKKVDKQFQDDKKSHDLVT